MPPKSTSRQPRGNAKTPTAQASNTIDSDSSDPFASEDEGPVTSNRTNNASGKDRSKAIDLDGDNAVEEAQEEAEPEKTIPKDLLTRILHEFFAKDATRISRGANEAVGKYVDVFVREAIARAAVEKRAGFFEVCLTPIQLYFGKEYGSNAKLG